MISTGKGDVLTFINKSASGVFEPETISILVGAFDDAWKSVLSSGAPFAEERYQQIAREISEEQARTATPAVAASTDFPKTVIKASIGYARG